MLKMNNGWFITDDASMQCVKRINEKRFLITDAIWLDTCGDDPRAENAKDEFDNYVVAEAVIDVGELTLHEIECAISVFYDSVSQMMEYYHSSFEDLYQLIAECYFESGLCEYSRLSKLLSWNDAEAYIQNIIDSK